MNSKPAIWMMMVALLTGAVIVLGFVVISNQQTMTSLQQRLVSVEQRLVSMQAGEQTGANVADHYPVPNSREPQPQPRDAADVNAAPPDGRGFRAAAFSDVEMLRDPNVPVEEKLARARSLLQSPFPPSRMMAINTLVENNDAEALTAIREFIESAGDDRMSRRMVAGAIDMLADVNGNGADTLLYEYLDGDEESVSIRAATALEKRGDNGPLETMVQGYSARLDDADGGVRSRAVQSLGSMRSATAIPALQVAITDTNSEVRMRTAEALGRTGSEEAVEYLLPLLDDPIQEVRDSASRSLDQIRNPRQQALPFIRR